MRYIVCTLIEIDGHMPDMTDQEAVDALLMKSLLGPNAIKSAWICPVIEDLSEIYPNVSNAVN